MVRHTLQNGDVVLAGKHKLMFDERTDAAPLVPEPVMSGMGDTVYLALKNGRETIQARTSADDRLRLQETPGPSVLIA